MALSASCSFLLVPLWHPPVLEHFFFLNTRDFFFFFCAERDQKRFLFPSPRPGGSPGRLSWPRDRVRLFFFFFRTSLPSTLSLQKDVSLWIPLSTSVGVFLDCG